MEKSNNTFTAEAFQKFVSHLESKDYKKVCYDNKTEDLVNNSNLYDFVSTNKDNPKSIYICRIDKPDSGNTYLIVSEIHFDTDGALNLLPVVCITCNNGTPTLVKSFMDQYGNNLIK